MYFDACMVLKINVTNHDCNNDININTYSLLSKLRLKFGGLFLQDTSLGKRRN